MLDLLPTLDYEAPGDGNGDVMSGVIEPTRSLMRVLEGHGAKLTVFFEVGEYWAYCEAGAKGQLDHLKCDPAAEMRRQVQEAVSRGHDVQLHLHPQWLGSEVENGVWKLDRSKVRLSSLHDEEMRQVLARGKQTLESLLRTARPGYECSVFRAGGLCIQPEAKILGALAALGFRMDSSVAPGLKFRSDEAFYDFPDGVRRPCWRISDSVTREDPAGQMWEVPITTRPMFVWQRDFRRKIRKLLHSATLPGRPSAAPRPAGRGRFWGAMSPRHYYLDMGDSARITIKMLKFFLQKSHCADVYPVVMLGHPFELASVGEWEQVLRFCDGQVAHGNLRYSKFGDILPLLAANAA